jgi:phenylacetate-CoA ligase
MRDGALDRFEVHCEVTTQFMNQVGSLEENPEVGKLVKAICQDMKNALGVSVMLCVNKPNSIPRSEGKAIRIVDNRNRVLS